MIQAAPAVVVKVFVPAILPSTAVISPVQAVSAAVPQAWVVPEAAPEGSAAPKAELKVVKVAASPLRTIQIVEVPARLSFERLRRENYRFPDSSTANRFIELSTELPPLFGGEE